MERKVLNAERIKNKGIKPENLRSSRRSCSGDDLLFDIYDCTKVLFVGELRIANTSAKFAEKAFNPVEIWFCCDDPLATYNTGIHRRIFISQPMNGRSDEAYTAEDIRTTIMLMIKRAPTVSNVSAVHAHWETAPTLFDEKDIVKFFAINSRCITKSLLIKLIFKGGLLWQL